MPSIDSNAVVAVDDQDDDSLIRWMLSLTFEQRLAVLQGFVDSVLELSSEPPST